MVRPKQLGHANIRVRDLERSEKFYTEVLGLKVNHKRDNIAFLSVREHSHELAIRAMGTDAPGPDASPKVIAPRKTSETRNPLAPKSRYLIAETPSASMLFILFDTKIFSQLSMEDFSSGSSHAFADTAPTPDPFSL